MSAGELLQQVRLLDPISATDRVVDVWIADGCIQQISADGIEVPQETTVRNCGGLVLGPGLVDSYSHSGEPGHEERENLDSLLAAARCGGFTRMAILPDTIPRLDNPSSIAFLQERCARVATVPSVSVWAGMFLYDRGGSSQSPKGPTMAELAELAQLPSVAGFADGEPLSDLVLMRRLLEYAKPYRLPVALYACDVSVGGVMREGIDSIRCGLPGCSAIAHTAPLAALLEVVAVTQTPVHIMRVSTQRGVELIADAKRRQLPVTASTTWMHLLLDTTAIAPLSATGDGLADAYNPNLHLNPPLGTPSDRAALQKGVQMGTIDAIAIDHTPYTYEEKTVPFSVAPPGAIGLELALPLLWKELVVSEKWTAIDLWRALSASAARCLRQKPAKIAPGEPAELVLFDPHQSWTCERDRLQSVASNTFWYNKSIPGRVVQIWYGQQQFSAT
jgi:dihydroorotase